ncbi:MAG: hydroxymethylglutaryl-CoA lyase [Phycisphaerales bacterium]
MERVRITDVSPRDGLQNEPGVISTADKVELIRLLCATGVDEVEVTSFVSPKWVPQLADAAAVCAALPRSGLSPSLTCFSALVPNAQGLGAFLAARPGGGGRGGSDPGADQRPVVTLNKASIFTAASETFSKKNTNATIAETLERFGPVVSGAHEAALLVRGYISCVVACPFEGPVAPGAVARVARRLVDLGVDEIDLGDTIGAGTAESVLAVLAAVRAELGGAWLRADRLTLHLHDTFGRASECVRAALGAGVRSFDGSVAGLGGCPYAGTPGKRAPGNISTELLVRTVHDAGFATGVDMGALTRAAGFARGIVAAGRAG